MESEVAVDFPADEDVHQITHKPTVCGLSRLDFLHFKITKAFFAFLAAKAAPRSRNVR